MTIHLKKHCDGNAEFVNAADVFDVIGHTAPKAEETFAFLLLVEKVLNYFSSGNVSTAFGNPDLARAEGTLTGYCMAKSWDMDEKDGCLVIRKGKRTLFRIEKPGLPCWEKENRKEIADLRREMGF